MSVDVFYIKAPTSYDLNGVFLKRFMASFVKHPPGHEDAQLHVLEPATSPSKDIGAYIQAAKKSKADLMVCIGSHVRINADNWLLTIGDTWSLHGNGLYGPFGTNEPWSHLRTTCFWCEPQLLANYPWQVLTDQDRYNFELDPEKSITTYADEMGLTVGQVIGSSVYTYVF